MMFAEQPQIIICAVHDQFMSRQRIQHRSDIYPSQRIDEFVSGYRADLYQANFFRIGMKAVCLRVHSHPGRGLEHPYEDSKFFRSVDHLSNIFSEAEKKR